MGKVQEWSDLSIMKGFLGSHISFHLLPSLGNLPTFPIHSHVLLSLVSSLCYVRFCCHSLTHLVLEKEWNEPKWGERATGEWTERRVRRTEEQSKPRINRIWWVLFSALSPFPTLIPALCFSLLFHWLFSCVHFAFACSLPQPNEHEWNKGGMSGEWVKGRAQRSQVEPYEHTNARECLTVPVDSKG